MRVDSWLWKEVRHRHYMAMYRARDIEAYRANVAARMRRLRGTVTQYVDVGPCAKITPTTNADLILQVYWHEIRNPFRPMRSIPATYGGRRPMVE
jgi:hypothetical protein